MSSIDLLKNIYLFKDFNPDELAQITEISELVEFAPGQTIFKEGDQGDSLFVIKSGTVRIRHKSKEGHLTEIAQLSTGSHFGEISFFDGGKRSATVEAFEKLSAVKINYENLRKVLNGKVDTAAKFYRSLASFLCGRLRVTTSDLSYAKEMMIHLF